MDIGCQYHDELYENNIYFLTANAICLMKLLVFSRVVLVLTTCILMQIDAYVIFVLCKKDIIQ